jgi:hypothetical protein
VCSEYDDTCSDIPLSMGAATTDGDSSLLILRAVAVAVAVGLAGERRARMSSSNTEGLDGNRPCFSSGTTSWLMSMVDTEFIELDRYMWCRAVSECACFSAARLASLSADCSTVTHAC